MGNIFITAWMCGGLRLRLRVKPAMTARNDGGSRRNDSTILRFRVFMPNFFSGSDGHKESIHNAKRDYGVPSLFLTEVRKDAISITARSTTCGRPDTLLSLPEGQDFIVVLLNQYHTLLYIHIICLIFHFNKVMRYLCVY
jgi:hypothetical protein